MWQDKVLQLVNLNEFVRMMVIIIIILIMLKTSTEPIVIIRIILFSILGVFAYWFIINIDYFVFKFIK